MDAHLVIGRRARCQDFVAYEFGNLAVLAMDR
jgi:hypothetical protein